MNLIQHLSKYSPEHVIDVITECGGLNAIFRCMTHSDIFVKDAALQAFISVVSLGVNISQLIMNIGN